MPVKEKNSMQSLNKQLTKEFDGDEAMLNSEPTVITPLMQEGLAAAYALEGFKNYLVASINNSAYKLTTMTTTPEDIAIIKATILAKKQLLNKMKDAADAQMKKPKS